MRDYLHTCLNAVGSPFGQVLRAALLATNMDAHELNMRMLAGHKADSIAYRSKVFSMRAAGDTGYLLIAPYENRIFGSRPFVEY